MSKNMIFGTLGSLLPFSTPPPKLIKKQKFSQMIFLLFSFVTLSLLAKNYASITKIVNFGPLGPFFERAPELIKNGNFQKLQCLLFKFVTLSLLTKNYVSITKIAGFSP